MPAGAGRARLAGSAAATAASDFVAQPPSRRRPQARRWSAFYIAAAVAAALLATATVRRPLVDWAGSALARFGHLSLADDDGNELPSETVETAAVVDRFNLSDALGTRGAIIFRGLDSDNNGRLTAAEFAPVVEVLTGESPPVLRERRGAATAGSTAQLAAFFTPLEYKSMKIVQDEGVQGLMRNVKNLKGLSEWREPAQPQQEFVSTEFRPFTPAVASPVGEAYFIYRPDVETFWRGTNTRYYPPVPGSGSGSSPERILYKLLRMLHPRPFVLTRFGPYGSVAVVQGENERYYNIAFRIHAEFQLNEPPLYPFWYSPAQFSGNLVIAKDCSTIQQFHMSVPNDRLLNVDMEWVTAIEPDTQSERMEVEIGYMPRMEVSYNTSTEAMALRWDAEISREQAASSLERLLYPFKKVDYYPLLDALEKAERQEKLVHSIILWGSLDDQSC